MGDNERVLRQMHDALPLKVAHFIFIVAHVTVTNYCLIPQQTTKAYQQLVNNYYVSCIYSL